MQRLPKPTRERRPASWQRALRWVAWLTFLGLAVANSDQASFGGVELLALAVAIGVSIFCVARPMGPPDLTLTKAAHVIGEFRSRTNWALVLIGTLLVVGGVGASGAIAYDLSTGRATVGDVFEDIGIFIEGWTVEVFTQGGIDAELEKTRAYALCFLLVVGIPLLLYNLGPLFRRRPFRVDRDGAVEVAADGGWVPLTVREYGQVVADGGTIRFTQAETGDDVVLPQRRIFERETGVRLEGKVSAAFFRRLLTQEGFTFDGMDEAANVDADGTAYDVYEPPVGEPEGDVQTTTATTKPGAMFIARR